MHFPGVIFAFFSPVSTSWFLSGCGFSGAEPDTLFFASYPSAVSVPSAVVVPAGSDSASVM